MSNCLEIGRNRRLCGGAIEYEQRIADLTAQLAAMTAERDRLREAIEKAPHTQNCERGRKCGRAGFGGLCGMHPESVVHDMGHPAAKLHHRFEPSDCTCWKRAALDVK